MQHKVLSRFDTSDKLIAGGLKLKTKGEVKGPRQNYKRSQPAYLPTYRQENSRDTNTSSYYVRTSFPKSTLRRAAAFTGLFRQQVVLSPLPLLYEPRLLRAVHLNENRGVPTQHTDRR